MGWELWCGRYVFEPKYRLIYQLMRLQYAARKGYNIIPVDRVQGYVKGVNLRSAINDNIAFKISFGLMFALAAFGEF